MAIHELDDGLPVFGESGDITDADARYAFFEGVVQQNLDMVRKERDRLLKETDWWAYEDTPVMTPEQIAYRQALREITTTCTSLHDVVWPEKP